MDWKLELVILPVSDVDRAKAFYVDKVGFHADYDQRVNEQLRFGGVPSSTSAIRMATAGLCSSPRGRPPKSATARRAASR